MGAGKCQPSILEQIKNRKNNPILNENEQDDHEVNKLSELYVQGSTIVGEQQVK